MAEKTSRVEAEQGLERALSANGKLERFLDGVLKVRKTRSGVYLAEGVVLVDDVGLDVVGVRCSRPRTKEQLHEVVSSVFVQRSGSFECDFCFVEAFGIHLSPASPLLVLSISSTVCLR